jgi:hypothetical protein
MLDLKTSSGLARSKYTLIGRHNFLEIFDSAYWSADRAFSHCNLTNPWYSKIFDLAVAIEIVKFNLNNSSSNIM